MKWYDIDLLCFIFMKWWSIQIYVNIHVMVEEQVLLIWLFSKLEQGGSNQLKISSTLTSGSFSMKRYDTETCVNKVGHKTRNCSALFLFWIINNYWTRLSMISWIIKAEVWVIIQTQTRGFDNSWYHAKTEFNNCFIIHFSHNSSSETEAKRLAILFLRRTLQGA